VRSRIRETGGGLILFSVAAVGLQSCGPANSGGSGAAQVTPTTACLNAMDPATGIGACRAAIADDPNFAPTRRRMALLRLKSGTLPAARQAYQIAASQDPKDAEAQFGLGLTLEAIGEAGGNIQKLEAAKRDPSVIDRFRKYGFAEEDLMTFDTAPQVLGGVTSAQIRAMTPKLPLSRSLGIDVKCRVGAQRLHDCRVLTPLPADQAPFADAAKAIASLNKVKPAKNNGAPVLDAPVLLTMVFEPRT